MLGDLTYEYDKNGNRTKIGGSFARTGIPQPVSSTAYNAANHQTTFGDKTLTYDENGNLLTITDASGTTTYPWNARNQLVGISSPGVNGSFVYDGLGRRERKTINGNLTEFLYDGLNPVQETSGATVLANIIPGLGIDEFLTRTDVVAGATSAFLTDALGSPVAATDNTGVVQIEYTYEPFGKTTATGASNTNPFQYTSRENDGTGLYYYRARYYHPQLQRFISEDPIEFAGEDINLYGYVKNDPVDLRDPAGQFATVVGGAVGGAVTGGIAGALGGAATSFLSGGSASDIAQAAIIGGAIGGIVGAVAGASLGAGLPGGLGTLADMGWGFDVGLGVGEGAALTSKLGLAAGVAADILFGGTPAHGSMSGRK